MKEILDAIYWRFADMVFEEKSHTYTVGGKVLPSVSGYVKSHETYVDFDSIARSMSNGSESYYNHLKRSWKKAGDDACKEGHITHYFAEVYDGSQTPNTLLEQAAKSFLDNLPSYYEIVFRELRMYHSEFDFAGTTDIVLLDKRDNTFVIVDYKTNKDLWKSYHMLQPPFSELEQNNFNKYQLQLSYYQILLEQCEGVKVLNRYIIWLKRDGTYQIIPTKDYTTALKKCLLKSKDAEVSLQ